MARELPVRRFSDIVHIPTGVHRLGGISRGKAPSVKRMEFIADDFEILEFDTSGLMIKDERAGVEIPIRYRHRETGVGLETMIANFWLSKMAGRSS
jgi:hypothetical protein